MIYSRQEIEDALRDNWDEVHAFVRDLSGNDFVRSPAGKWSPGQHVEHLIRSAVPLRKALGYPRFALRWLIGKPNRPSRDFNTTEARYQEKLKAGGAASGRYTPPAIPAAAQSSVLATYLQERDRMLHQLRRWDDDALEKYLMPHPLLGKVTVREMMFFTTFHTAHHLRLIRRDLGR
ncbi:MAG: DinB family protein [Bacteroidota bacterium]